MVPAARKRSNHAQPNQRKTAGLAAAELDGRVGRRTQPTPVALVLTLLLALTSITCYSHALQFQCQQNYGKALVRLGSKFDSASFYLLSGPLLLAAALWRPCATYVFGLLFALLLYRSYFFRLPGG